MGIFGCPVWSRGRFPGQESDSFFWCCWDLLPSLSSHSSVPEDKFGVLFVPWSGTWVGRFLCVPLQICSFRLWRRIAMSLSPLFPDGIIVAIKSAGSEALVSAKPRAHDTRGLSTSWALFNGASIDQITKAAYWSNSNSFISCYLRDVVALEATFGLASLGASGLLALTLRVRGDPPLISPFSYPPPFLVFGGLLCYSGTVKDYIGRWARILYSNYKNLYWFYYLIRILAHLPRLPAHLPPFHFIYLTQRKEGVSLVLTGQ